jgi:hypothetical protein
MMVTSLGIGFAAPAQASADPGGWGLAAPLAAVNDPVAADGCPIEAPNGKALFFASVRGAGGDNDIWVATRSSLGEDFGAPVMLPAPVNSDAQDFCPTPLRGGALLFVSTRGGTDAYGTVACGLGDIYVTSLNRVTGLWAEPRNLGCAPDGPNGPGMEYGPSLVRAGPGAFLYFSSGDPVGAGTQDIYRSRLSAGLHFGGPTAVTELNVAGYDDYMPNVSRDGREIVFASSRPGGLGASDIYTATRSRIGHDHSGKPGAWCAWGTWGAWGAPVNLGPTVNTEAGESRPTLSRDGERLYFGRSGEIYLAQRV